MDEYTEIIPVELENGKTISIELSHITGGSDVSSIDGLSFENFAESIREIVASVEGAINSVKPDKATIEFGVEAGVESGQLTAILVKGSGKANLKISLEWENKNQK